MLTDQLGNLCGPRYPECGLRQYGTGLVYWVCLHILCFDVHDGRGTVDSVGKSQKSRRVEKGKMDLSESLVWASMGTCEGVGRFECPVSASSKASRRPQCICQLGYGEQCWALKIRLYRVLSRLMC